MPRAAFVLACVFLVSATVTALELRPATLAGYRRYVDRTEARIAAARAGTVPLLWVDRQPAAVRAAVLARLRRGEVVVEPVETRDEAGHAIEIEGGLVHHWVGTVLLPAVSIDRAAAFVQDYDAYPTIFGPFIRRARVLEHSGDHYVVAMRTFVSKIVTVVMDGDYVIDYRRVSPTELVSTTVATHLFEVHDAGHADERREPADQASGDLWRYRMYCAFEAHPDGSLEQCESITLTRPVPFLVGWLVKPLLMGIPRDTLAFTLERVRAGLAR